MTHWQNIALAQVVDDRNILNDVSLAEQMTLSYCFLDTNGQYCLSFHFIWAILFNSGIKKGSHGEEAHF